MVKILNIALYIIFILIPALYFIWLLKHEHLIFKTFVVVMAILSTIGILLKFKTNYICLFDYLFISP